MAKVIIDPVNRMEGHLKADCDITAPGVAESGGVRVTSAHLSGNMYRGFEQLLRNRDPRDAMVITQRH